MKGNIFIGKEQIFNEVEQIFTKWEHFFIDVDQICTEVEQLFNKGEQIYIIQNHIEAPHFGFLSTLSVPRHHPLYLLLTCKLSTSPQLKSSIYFFYRFSMVNSIRVCNLLFTVECCNSIFSVSPFKLYLQNL
jgi:hypothetical protein